MEKWRKKTNSGATFEMQRQTHLMVSKKLLLDLRQLNGLVIMATLVYYSTEAADVVLTSPDVTKKHGGKIT